MICIGEYTAVATVLTALAGSMTPESVRTYVSINADPWDNNDQIDLEEPMGGFGIEFDIHKHLRLFAEHLSSPMQCNDFPGVNHAGAKLLAPITNDLTVYSGISINNSSFDSNDNFDGPLGSVGVEYGKSLKFFAEHLANVREFAKGRTSLGFKVFFK